MDISTKYTVDQVLAEDDSDTALGVISLFIKYIGWTLGSCIQFGEA